MLFLARVLTDLSLVVFADWSVSVMSWTSTHCGTVNKKSRVYPPHA